MVHFGDFVLGFTFLLWTVTVHLGTGVWTPVTAEPRVIGSSQPIIAVLGDDVILPCHLEPEFNVVGLTVEWSKPDVKPDPSDRLSRVEYVHLYRDRREVQDMKIQSYVKRTALSKNGLRRGNISLKIMNVTLEDEGRYRCFIPKLKSRVKDSVVQLIVEANSVPTTEAPLDPRNLQTPAPTEEPDVKAGGRSHLSTLIPAVVICILLILVGVGGAGGYLLKLKCHEQNLPKYDVAQSKPLPV